MFLYIGGDQQRASAQTKYKGRSVESTLSGIWIADSLLYHHECDFVCQNIGAEQLWIELFTLKI